MGIKREKMSNLNFSCSENLPTLVRQQKRKKKITQQDVTELQYKILMKENQKLDLQIQLLKKLNSSQLDNFTASDIFASFS